MYYRIQKIKQYQKTVLQEKEGVQLQVILNYGKIQKSRKELAMH